MKHDIKLLRYASEVIFLTVCYFKMTRKSNIKLGRKSCTWERIHSTQSLFTISLKITAIWITFTQTHGVSYTREARYLSYDCQLGSPFRRVLSRESTLKRRRNTMQHVSAFYSQIVRYYGDKSGFYGTELFTLHGTRAFNRFCAYRRTRSDGFTKSRSLAVVLRGPCALLTRRTVTSTVLDWHR